MKRLFLLWLLLASFVANAQSLPGISARPPGLPDFSPFRLDPFSFSFQIKKPYVVDGPIAAEVYNNNTKIIDSTDIDVTVQDNYVTVSFTKQQIAALPALSTCYIIWNGTRQLATNLKPGMGSGQVSQRKIEVGIVEIQIVGDTKNSLDAADRSEAARDTAIIKSLSAKEYADSASAAKEIADAKSEIATEQAIIATSAADSSLTLRSQSLTYRNDAEAAKDTALHYATVVDSIASVTHVLKDSAFVSQQSAEAAKVQAEIFKNQAQAASGAAVAAKKFQSVWDVTANSPNLSALSLGNTSTDIGKYWEVSVAGTSSLTGTSLSYIPGDGVVWTGTAWVKTVHSDLGIVKATSVEQKVEAPYITENIIVNSANLAAWSNVTGLTSRVPTTDINGTNLGVRLVENSSTSEHRLTSPTFNITAGVPVTATVYVKAGTSTAVAITLGQGATWGGSGSPQVKVDLVTGVVTSNSPAYAFSGTAVLVKDGWWRVSVTSTTHITGPTELRLGLMLATSPSYPGNGARYADFCFPQASTTLTPINYVHTYASAITRESSKLLTLTKEQEYDLKPSAAAVASAYSTKSQGVAFVSVIGTNKLDTLALLADKFILNTGLLGTAGSPGTYVTTDSIPFGSANAFVAGYNAGTKLIFSTAQYNSSGAFVSSSYFGPDNVSTPINKVGAATHFRITYRLTPGHVTNINQINLGTTLLAYEPYSKKNVASKNALNVTSEFEPDLTKVKKSTLQWQGVWSEFKLIKVKKDGTGDFTSLAAALNSITDASPANKYCVQLYDDIYATVKADYTAVSGTSFFALAHVRSYIKLMGMNGVRTISGTLPTDLVVGDYPVYETMHLDGFGELENLRIVNQNGRYGIHYEQSNASPNWDGIWYARNCEVIHMGCEDVPSITRWMQPDAIGCGTTTGVQFRFVGLRVFSYFRHGLRIHANTLDDQQNEFRLQDSFFGSGLPAGNALYIDNTPTSRNARIVYLNNSQLQGTFYTNIAISTGTKVLRKAVPSIQVKGSGNSPFYFNNDQQAAHVLRIRTVSTGASATIRVVSDQAGILGSIMPTRGSPGLSAAIMGDQELTESGTADRSNLIGHRLGNCTSVNKTLVLNIDGTNRTVTFNQNYSDGNFATAPLIDANTIMTSINSQLSGFAVAGYYQPALDYYPELTDVLFRKVNTSATTHITKGSLVKFMGLNQCRIAAAGEIADGVALENIVALIGEPGRIATNAIFSKTSFLFETGSDTFVEGDKFKVSASGKLLKDNTLTSYNIIALDTDKILIKSK